MKVYRVAVDCRVVDESDPPRDEFYETSEQKARAKVREIIDAADSWVYGVKIERVYFADLTPRALALAILNGSGYVAKRVLVASWERVGEKWEALPL